LDTETVVDIKAGVVKLPELRFLKDGRPMCTVVFPLPTSRHGEDSKPYWLQTTMFGGLAECVNSVPVGSVIVVRGRLSASRWKGNDGVERASLGVVGFRAGMYESFSEGIKWFEWDRKASKVDGIEIPSGEEVAAVSASRVDSGNDPLF